MIIVIIAALWTISRRGAIPSMDYRSNDIRVVRLVAVIVVVLVIQFIFAVAAGRTESPFALLYLGLLLLQLALLVLCERGRRAGRFFNRRYFMK